MHHHGSFFSVVPVPAFQLPMSFHGGNQRAGIANDSGMIAEVIPQVDNYLSTAYPHLPRCIHSIAFAAPVLPCEALPVPGRVLA